MSKALTPFRKGSLADVAGGVTTNPHKMAMALRNSELMILVDCSSSMLTQDAGDHEDQARSEAAQECLDILQERFPGKVAVGAFSSESHGLVHTGVLPKPAGSTPLHTALDFFYPTVITTGMKFVVVSDGEPDDPSMCIRLAQKEKYPIYCIYVGPVSNNYRGREFMERLASESGGEFDFVSLKNILLLVGKISGYLTAPKAEKASSAPTAAQAAN